MRSPLESVLEQAWRNLAGPVDFATAVAVDRQEGQSDLVAEYGSVLREVFGFDIAAATISAHDSLTGLASCLERLREGEQQQRGEAPASAPTPAASHTDAAEDSPPASYGQAGLWYIDQSAVNPAIYNAPLLLKLGFAADPALLEKSLRRVVARHEVLRTTFTMVDGEVVQRISPEPQVDFSVARYADDAEYHEILRRVMDTPFDLEKGPLLRVVCAIDREERIHVMCNVHHIVFDATSVGLFLEDWFSAFVKLRDGLPDTAEPPAAQYRDFVRWQRERLGSASLDRILDYWQKNLSGPLPLLDLPLDKPRPSSRTREGDVSRFQVPPELADKLRKRAAQEGVTLYMLLLSAYAVFLHKYTRQSEVLIGSPASLRDTPQTQQMLGYLVNMIVLRQRMTADMTLAQLHRAVREDVICSLQHKHAPLDKIIERVQPERSTGHSPLFQTMFVMPNSDATTLDRLGVDVQVELYGSHSAKYDLSLIVEDRDSDGGLSGIFEYDTGLFHRSTVEAMGRHFVHLLQQFADTSEARLDQLRLLDQEQEAAAVRRCSRERGSADIRPVMDLFREQALRTPDDIAVEYDGRRLTYRQLDERSNRLAHYLRSRGVAAGCRVGIFLERSEELVVGLLGVLKSGAAYVPIDPSYPQDRIGYALGDSDARLVLTQKDLGHRLPAGQELLNLDEARDAVAAFPSTDPGPVKRPQDEIYVIYTSGSTGLPKGVVLNDATIANLVEYQLDVTAVGRGARTLQYMSLSFDVSLQEILGTLCGGGTLVLIPDELRKDLHRLAEFMRRERIARAYFPYIALQHLAAVATGAGLRLDALREVVSTGEQLVVSPQIREFFAAHPRARLWNMYGPSETHVVSAHRLPDDPASWGETASIGRPLPGFSMLVLDAGGNLVPPGIPGELYLGGELISPGYNRLPEETARRFAVHPLLASPDRPTGRIYRTGDLVRVDAEGNFEYLGRVDDQVKIRGYRVEPAEVEAALNSLHVVDASAVGTVRLDSGDTRLVAYLDARERTDDGTLRELLAGLLPDYMMPSHFVHLDRIPTTPSGKIDRKKLPELFEPTSPVASAPPTTPTEREIANRWSALLKTEDIGAHDDFFARGGHSILATQLVYQLRDHFGVDVPLRELLDRPTVAGMAACIDALRAAPDRSGPAPAARCRQDLRAQIRLPESVRVPAGYRPAEEGGRRTREARDVLLTGATGFLGTYLLRDLLAHTDVRVHCLVRAANHAQARQRLKDAALGYGLRHDLDTDRVVPVLGDLSQERLGLDRGTYRELSRCIDAVYHAAAHINFVAPYASVKPTNVDGMTAVLQFCAEGQPTPLHYASTIAVFSPAEDREVITESCVPEDHRQLGIGYTQSKWVAEHLAQAARERGLPVSVYRMGRISGDAATGACQADDFLWRQIKSFIQLGTAPPPEQLTTDLLPVDFVSRAFVLLSRHSEGNETFHLFHPSPATFDVVHTAIREAGYPLEVVSSEQWFASLEAAAARAGDNALAAAVPLFQEGALELGENVYGNDTTRHALQRLGMAFPPIDVEAVSRMIDYFRRAGELP
ncbi:amino acid adenylation domain-containing protein [Streptomyces smyrnaeus]|uniref:non-ribosomal peptide synthetase family protein n=1 Tax=Streptomyces smyrnaeus TaxID=1387713 RepID=UPI0036AC126F